MSPYQALADDQELVNPRWLCGCGREHTFDGKAYPICPECGQRARIVTGDDLPYVDSRESRLESAESRHRKAYEDWTRTREALRRYVESYDGTCRSCLRREGHEGWCHTSETPWWPLRMAADLVNWMAGEVDWLEAKDRGVLEEEQRRRQAEASE